LSSVEIIVKKECCVGQPITLQLMKRARNSLQAYPISELRQNTYRLSDNIPLSVCESKFSTSYSRILIGHKSQVSCYNFKTHSKYKLAIKYLRF
jgi:hypothetical protein